MVLGLLHDHRRRGSSSVLHTFIPVHLHDPVYEYVSTKINPDLPGHLTAKGCPTHPAAPQQKVATQPPPSKPWRVPGGPTGNDSLPQGTQDYHGYKQEIDKILLRKNMIAFLQALRRLHCFGAGWPMPSRANRSSKE